VSSPAGDSTVPMRVRTTRASRLGSIERMIRLGVASRLAIQFGRYLIVGGLAFVIDFGSLYLLTERAGMFYLASAAIAFILGLLTNYVLCRIWVFTHRVVANGAVEFAVFALIGVAGLGLNEAVIWFACDKLGLHYLNAKLASAALVVLWNFGARKAILFRDGDIR